MLLLIPVLKKLNVGFNKKMKKKKLIKFLNEISENGVSYAHGKGFEFFRDELLPNSKHAEQLIGEEELLSDFWYVIGDIYDFNNAPLKAIESYQVSIDIDPKNWASYRELGNMQERIGEYSNAISSMKKAIKIAPSDENTISDLKDTENYLKNNQEPLYIKNSLIWKLHELLANQQFNEVIKLTKNSKKANELKSRANAYAGLNESLKYLELWNLIEQSNIEVEIEYSDWFYMPNEVYESDQIWRIFKQMNKRIKSSIFIQSESFYTNYKGLSDLEKRELMCDYNIYENTANKEALNKLRIKYPKWDELKTQN